MLKYHLRVITFMNRKYLIIAIVILIIIGAGAFALTNSNTTNTNSISIDANGLEDKGSLVVDSESLSESNVKYHADSADVNAILIKNGGSLSLSNSHINKTGDTATSGDDADFYGVNSAILVNTNGTLDISNAEITTNSKGSNGIFVTNAEASANSSESAQGSAEGGQQPQSNGTGGGDGGQPPEAQGSAEGGQPPEAPDSGNAPSGQGGGEQPGQSTVEGTTEAKISNVK
jgi:hypothetical protein